MRVLVCGGRDFFDFDLVKKTLNEIENIECIIQGGAEGADSLGKLFAKINNIPWKETEFKADWKNPIDGIIRNTRMIVEGKPDLVVAFCGGSGTNDMIKQTIANRIKLITVK